MRVLRNTPALSPGGKVIVGKKNGALEGVDAVFSVLRMLIT